jgi:hypothetical protein
VTADRPVGRKPCWRRYGHWLHSAAGEPVSRRILSLPKANACWPVEPAPSKGQDNQLMRIVHYESAGVKVSIDQQQEIWPKFSGPDTGIGEICRFATPTDRSHRSHPMFFRRCEEQSGLAAALAVKAADRWRLRLRNELSESSSGGAAPIKFAQSLPPERPIQADGCVARSVPPRPVTHLLGP